MWEGELLYCERRAETWLGVVFGPWYLCCCHFSLRDLNLRPQESSRTFGWVDIALPRFMWAWLCPFICSFVDPLLGLHCGDLGSTIEISSFQCSSLTPTEYLELPVSARRGKGWLGSRR